MKRPVRRLPAETESWEILKAHSKDVVDVDVPYTAVVRRIEDRADYHDLLRRAGLPVPEPPPVELELEDALPGNGSQPDETGMVSSFGGDSVL